MGMIYDKEIDIAARAQALSKHVNETSYFQLRSIEDFKDGAKWAIKQFLKDLWHPYDEVPTRKDSNMLQFFESYSTGTEDDFDEYFELAHTREGFTQETWEEFVNESGVPSKWVYLDDLFPKGFCTHNLLI